MLSYLINAAEKAAYEKGLTDGYNKRLSEEPTFDNKAAMIRYEVCRYFKISEEVLYEKDGKIWNTFMRSAYCYLLSKYCSMTSAELGKELKWSTAYARLRRCKVEHLIRYKDPFADHIYKLEDIIKAKGL